jgi:transposase
VSRVSETAPQLPTDIEALHALVAAARAERDAALTERDQALSQLDRLRHLLRQLQRAQFGRRSEKLDPEQLLLALEDIEQAVAANEAADDKKNVAAARARAEKRRTNRGALSAHLPRVDVTIEPEDTNCRCCRAPMHVIGEETSERLDVDPGAVPGDRDAPSQICLPGLRAGGGSGAGARTADQGRAADRGDGCPCPGCQICLAFAALSPGPDAARSRPRHQACDLSVLGGLCGGRAQAALPSAARKIAVDETVAPVLDPGRGRTKKGYFWAIARDDRAWGGTDPPAVAYSYAPGRGAVHALKLLEHYRGIVQCDGYAAYKTIADSASGEAITLAFCWAHLRRRFFDIAKDGNAPIASEALERIAALYAIEKTIRGQSAGERRAARQARSKPLVLALKAWFEQQLARVSAKSLIADAIRYAFHHWDGLTRFLDDGRIELDTNVVERNIALFAGHDHGAENWACIASLIETCKLHGVDPQTYFTDVLAKLVNLWPASRLDELMPWAWAAERPNNKLAA